jgi:hypothetical protein
MQKGFLMLWLVLAMVGNIAHAEDAAAGAKACDQWHLSACYRMAAASVTQKKYDQAELDNYATPSGF